MTRRHLVLLVVAAGLVTAGGIGYAAIPDAAGVYTACKLNALGTIRLIDPSLPPSSLLSHCTALEKQIEWNAHGQKGDPGIAGPPGPQGPPGPAGMPSGAITGYEYVVAGKHVDNDSSENITANCPAGKHVLGGGVTVDASSNATPFVQYSGPAGSATGWEARVRTQDAFALNAYVWAICAQVS